MLTERAANVVDLIGNDVVDLVESGWDHERDPGRFRRFVGRVCSEPETAAVLSASDPCRSLAEHFAAKESAYKVVVKLTPGIPFAHRRFEVDLRRLRVRHGAVELQLAIQPQEGAVHAWAWHGNGVVNTQFALRKENEHPSLAVRRVAAEMLARQLRVARSELNIVRPEWPGSWDGRGPPEVFWRGRHAAVDLSLSHHGRFVACASIERGLQRFERGAVNQ